MNITDIAFPNLGIYLKNVPQLIHIGNFTIAIYGIMLATGILFGFIFGAAEAKNRGIHPDYVWDFAVPAIFFSIMGARIYYVLMSWDSYKDNLISVFYLRQGGIAIYGAVIAAFITMYVYTRIRKIPYFVYADAVIMGLPLGQVIGRWGNFFNREVFGGYSNGLFAMQLPVAAVRSSDVPPSLAAHIDAATNSILVHPTFLYEGVWNLLVMLGLFLYRKHKRFEGELFFLYIAGYGIGRAIIEAIRTDQLMIPGTSIPISLALGLVSAVVAILFILVLRKKLPKAEYIVTGFEETPESLKQKEAKAAKEAAVNAGSVGENTENTENTEK